ISSNGSLVLGGDVLENGTGTVSSISGANATLNLGTTVAPRTFTVMNAASRLVVSANITGSGMGGLIKQGMGTLVLSGINNYPATQIMAGTLQLGSTTGLPMGGTVDLSANATLDLNSKSITIGALNLLSGSLVKTGSATLTVNGVLTMQGG